MSFTKRTVITDTYLKFIRYVYLLLNVITTYYYNKYVSVICSIHRCLSRITIVKWMI